MSKHNQGWPVPGSTRSVLVVGLLVGAVVMMSMTPARGDTGDCGLVAERLAQWTTREARRGLSAELLDDLQELSSILTECAGSGYAGRPEPGPGDGEAVTYRGMGSDVESWRPLVALYFASDQLDRALCLMTAESGGNLDARNPGSGAAGLMQVMPFWAGVFGYSYDDLFRPDVNLWVAGQILEKQGWSAWSPYLRGVCR